METTKTEETKIIYHVDDEDTPYLVKLPIPPDRVTLGDLKCALNRPNFKFFFKSMDDDFGVVKEEIVDDDGKLPCFNGRVVCWLVSAEGSSISDNTSQCTDTMSQRSDIRLPLERTVGIGDSRPPSFHATAVDHRDHLGDAAFTETESVVSSRRDHRPHHSSKHREKHYIDHNAPCNCKPPLPCGCGASRLNGHSKHSHGRPGPDRHRHGYDSSSMMTSDIETTSFLDSEDETTSRISTTTEETSVSRIHARHRRRRRRHRMPPMSRTSSISSITDSTMSLNIITVTLNLDTVNFLGISIVGQSNKGGDGGIYVGSIMKGGAVALDGRIEPGDMILQVNDINFENMSNDDAVRVLREAVQKPGPIKLVVAKCWDPNPKGYFTIPRMEPVRPIDPGAWVAHTEAARGPSVNDQFRPFGSRQMPPGFQWSGQAVEYPLRPPSVSTLTSTSSSITSSIPESDRQFQEATLSLDTDMLTICKALAAPDSGLDVRDRMWLKITIPNAFIGADVVDWLFSHVQGFQDRREARKYATQMLKANYIRHTVNKITFSEQCYYIFGDLCSKTFPFPLDLASLKVTDEDTVSEADRDTLGPLPPPSTQGPWGSSQISYTGSSYLSQPGSGFLPMNFGYSKELVTYTGFGKDGSLHSGSGGSSNGAGIGGVSCMGIEIRKEKECNKSVGSPAGSDSEVASQIRHAASDGRHSSHSSSGSSHHSGDTAGGGGVGSGSNSSHIHHPPHMGLAGPPHHHHQTTILEGMPSDLAEDDVLEYHFTDKGMV